MNLTFYKQYVKSFFRAELCFTSPRSVEKKDFLWEWERKSEFTGNVQHAASTTLHSLRACLASQPHSPVHSLGSPSLLCQREISALPCPVVRQRISPLHFLWVPATTSILIHYLLWSDLWPATTHMLINCRFYLHLSLLHRQLLSFCLSKISLAAL